VGFGSVHLLGLVAHGFATLPQWPRINRCARRILGSRHSRVTRKIGGRRAVEGVGSLASLRWAGLGAGRLLQCNNRVPDDNSSTTRTSATTLPPVSRAHVAGLAPHRQRLEVSERRALDRTGRQRADRSSITSWASALSRPATSRSAGTRISAGCQPGNRKRVSPLSDLRRR
jgi:hypothetical protein